MLCEVRTTKFTEAPEQLRLQFWCIIEEVNYWRFVLAGKAVAWQGYNWLQLAWSAVWWIKYLCSYAEVWWIHKNTMYILNWNPSFGTAWAVGVKYMQLSLTEEQYWRSRKDWKTQAIVIKIQTIEFLMVQAIWVFNKTQTIIYSLEIS